MTFASFPSREVLIGGFTFNDIATGRALGLSIVETSIVDTAVGTTFKTTWGFGTTYLRPTVAEGFTVVSTDAADSSAGIGARELAVTYLRLDGSQELELIAMNGTTPVLSTTTDEIRIISVVVVRAGTFESNVGPITVVGTTSALNMAIIPANTGTKQDGTFTIPKGFNAYIHGAVVTIADTTKDVTTRLLVGKKDAPLIEISSFLSKEFRDYVVVGQVVPELTDLIVESKVDTGTASVRLDPVLILIEIDKFKSTQP